MTKDNKKEPDFFDLYLEYTAKTECPTFFHRWTAVTCLAAYLGRNTYFRFGHFTLYPNLYTMLIGSPGTKKSSAIKIGAKLMKQAGYTTFAAKKTRQEKFLLDMAELSGGSEDGSDILDQNLFGSGDSIVDMESRPPAECFVAADEFNNFIGVGNLDFMSILGELWDYEGVYDHKLKNSKSIYIPEPTINILGGNTPTGFSQAFPSDAIGQGFFSRLLLVYGEPSGVKYTFPPAPDLAQQEALIAYLHKLKVTMVGEVTMTDDAKLLLDSIYHDWEGIDDVRFEHYTNRRLTHLIKLTLTIVAARLSMIIDVEDIVYANTLLTFTESLMPKALGEFGNARNSDVTHKVMQILDGANEPVPLKSIWKHVHQDLETREQLMNLINNLLLADKIQVIDILGTHGYLPIKKVRQSGVKGAVDWNLLIKAERDLL